MKNFAASRLKPFLDRYGLLLSGLVLLLFVLGINLDHVRWFLNTPPPAGLIWLGAGLGVVVAFSRFSNFSSRVYLFFSALLMSLQTTARLLPGLKDLDGMDFWSFSEFTRLHLQIFNLQLFSGWKGNFHGYLLLCFLFGICGAWLAWTTIRLKRPLAGLIPAGCLLGYENSLSQQDSGTLAIFMFFAVLLTSAASFREQHDNWEKKNISTPWELGDWPFSALLIAALVAILTFTIPYAVTEEGRRKIADFLKPEPQKAQTSSHVSAQADPFNEEITANDFNLHDLGNPPSRSSIVVLYLRVNDPPPPEYEPEILNNTNRRYYLRSVIYTTYNGSGWETEAVPPDTNPENPGAGRRLLVQEIKIPVPHTENLFSANLPVSSGEDTSFSLATSDGSPLLKGQTSSYTVQSMISDLQNSELQKSGSEYPALVRETYLQLPEDLPEMVTLLAGEITRSAATPLEKVLAVQGFLRQEYLYDLDTPPAAPGQDVVEYFLFQEKRGYCSHFASAMVILLRSSGVPARLAAGYTTWQYDHSENRYTVPASAAHAWVEVYFPQYGWVEFEPTPIHPQLLYAGNEVLPQFSEQENAAETQRKGFSLLAAAGILSICICLFLLSIWLLRVRARQKYTEISPAGKLYQQIRKMFSRAGLSAPGSITPNEFLQLAIIQFETYPGLVASLQETTRVYNQTLFSASPPDEKSVDQARLIWRAAFWERWKFLMYVTWDKLKEKMRGKRKKDQKNPNFPKPG